MARRRSHGPQRDTTDVANSPDLDPLTVELLRPVEVPRRTLSLIEDFVEEPLPADRRFFSFGEPEKYRLVSPVVPSRAVRSRAFVEPRVAFGRPSTVAICVRRKQRREVLFAKRRMRGRGGARRRSWHSDIKC